MGVSASAQAGASASSSGVGLLNLLGVLFVGLKLTGFIDWSWWWVTLPFYAPPAIALALLLLGAGALLVAKKWNGR